MRLAHLSDLHFGRTDARLIGPLTEELAHARPDLVIISGDLTLAAREREFHEAMTFVNTLPAPCFLVPGNHDIPKHHALERMMDPFRRWRRYVGRELEPTWVNDRVAIIGVNTVRRAHWRLNWSHGRIGRRHLQRIAGRLSTLPEGPMRVVVGHHPFFAPDPVLRNRVLRRSDEALAAFRRHNVRLVLAGHLHRAFVHEVPGEQPVAPMLVMHGGTTISTRLRGEANAFSLIDLQDDGAIDIDARVWSGSDWRREPPRRLTVPGDLAWP